MEISTRLGAVTDLRPLIAMHDQCSARSIIRRYLAPLPVVRNRLAARLLCPPGGFSLVAEHEGDLVGIVTVAPYDDTVADLGQLVADPYQRRGIGSRLLAEATQEAARRGFVELSLDVHPDNEAVLPMLASCGLEARVRDHDGLLQISVLLEPPTRCADPVDPACTHLGRVLKMG